MIKKTLIYTIIITATLLAGLFSHSKLQEVSASSFCIGTCCTPVCAGATPCPLIRFVDPCDATCEGQFSCSDGSLTCGSCPPAPGTTTGGGGTGGCTPSQPSLPVNLVAPTNNTLLTDNIAFLRWQNQGDWGVGCAGTNNRFTVNVQPGCTGAFSPNFTAGGQQSLGGNQFGQYTRNLDWNTEYCWFVNKCNSSRCRSSAIWRFRTPDVIFATQSGIVSPDTCGRNIIGRPGEPNVHNPITYRIAFEDPNNSVTFRELWLVFIPPTGAYGENSDVPNHLILNQKVANANTLGVRYNLDTGEVSVIGSGGAWTGNSTSGDLTNPANTASVLNIGGTTTANRSGNTVTGDFQIRLNSTFPSGLFNVYAAALVESADGVFYTSYSQPTDSTVYKRTSSIRTDMIRPTMSLTNPPNRVGAGNDYRLTLSMQDNAANDSGIRRWFSTLFADTPNHQMRTLGFQNKTILPVPTSEPATPNDVDLTWPSAQSTFNRSLRYYNDTPALGGDFYFRHYAQDSACNVTMIESTAAAPAPWFVGDVSTVSGVGGITNAEVPNVAITIPSGRYSGQAFAAVDFIISGAAGLPARASAKNFFATNYPDRASAPPVTASANNWYQHFLSRVTSNRGEPIQTGVSNLNGQIVGGSNLPGSANTYGAWRTAGNLSIQSGSTCNAQGIIFVEGDLTINPDFTNTNGTNGCIFVVQGNIIITNGTTKTATTVASAVPASYDIVEAFLITNGELQSSVDTQIPTNKWDGLLFKGGIFANILDLNRDVNDVANALQPSVYFIHDPRYKILLGDAVSRNQFSIREKGAATQ